MAWNTKVNSRYRAAMMAARVRERVESFMVDLPFGEAAAEKRRSMDLSMPSRARQHCRGANLVLFFRESGDSVRQEGCELSLLSFHPYYTAPSAGCKPI